MEERNTDIETLTDVWVVMLYWDYEGSQLVGVFSNEEAAIECANDHKADEVCVEGWKLDALVGGYVTTKSVYIR